MLKIITVRAQGYLASHFSNWNSNKLIISINFALDAQRGHPTVHIPYVQKTCIVSMQSNALEFRLWL